MFSLLFFMLVLGIVSYIDVKKGLILDKIMFPSFLVLLLLKYFDKSLVVNDFVAIAVVLMIFIVPIVLNMAFGGGDLRFGAFCALFLGLASVGYFIMFSGVIHLAFLSILKRKSFAFAPAMSLGALLAYIVGSL